MRHGKRGQRQNGTYKDNMSWDKWIHKSWFWTKCLFAGMAIVVASFVYGTFHPNSSIERDIKQEFVDAWEERLENFKDRIVN